MQNLVRSIACKLNQNGVQAEVKPFRINSSENLRGIFENVKVGETVVCACDSGDKPIASLLYGAKNVYAYTEAAEKVVFFFTLKVK